ncbi:hypothetical protein CR513_29479, partial [Mucuna pruriens]
AVQARKFEKDDELIQTFSKELCTNKRRKLKDLVRGIKYVLSKGDVDVERNVSKLIKSEQVSILIQLAMPKKCSNPGTFFVPCTIGKCYFDAMLDFDASINVMPSSVYRSLRLGALELTCIVIQLANKSTTHPLVILEDVLVQVSDMIFPIDFYMLNIKDELSSKGPTLILGKPFLKTAKTKIDVHARILSMEFGDNRVEYTIFMATKHLTKNHSIFNFDVIGQLGNDYINLHFEFSEFDDFTNYDCTCVEVVDIVDARVVDIACVNIARVIKANQKERLLQDLKKLGNFNEHLVKHSTL